MLEANTKKSQETQMSNLQQDERELIRRIAYTNEEITRIESELIDVREAARTIPQPPNLSSERPEGHYEKKTMITPELRNRVMDDEHGTDLGVQIGILNTSWMIDRHTGGQGKAKVGIIRRVPQGRRIVEELDIPKGLGTHEGLQDAQRLILTRLFGLKQTRDGFEQSLRDVRERLKLLEEGQQAITGS